MYEFCFRVLLLMILLDVIIVGACVGLGVLIVDIVYQFVLVDCLSLFCGCLT